MAIIKNLGDVYVGTNLRLVRYKFSLNGPLRTMDPRGQQWLQTTATTAYDGYLTIYVLHLTIYDI